ncbi:MAG TPA: 50S ribosomal protein L23 [Candidatus Paceibacterota bacterium]|nr:50S ribosomal protein L23 [Candidatus Paceibacterota bacterium]
MSRIGHQHNSPFQVMKQPRITEKSTILADRKAPVYTFEVEPKATKTSIKAAIKAQYKVTPVKVNIVTLPAKKKIRRGKVGTQSAVRKAFVFLKAGDKIELV